MFIPLRLASLYNGQVFVWSDCLLDLGTDSLSVARSLSEVCIILQWSLISIARILLCRSAVKVHDSQAYRKVAVTRERISRTLELREMLLSFQIGLKLVNAGVFCVILEKLSGLKPSKGITEPRFLKLVTV